MSEPRKPGKPKREFPDNVLELRPIFRERKPGEVIPLEAARRARRESREENEKKSE